MDSWIQTVGGGLGITSIAAFFTWLLGRVKRDARDEVTDENFMSQIRSLRDDLRLATDELRRGTSETTKLREETAVLQSSQNVVNSMTAKALDAIGSKQESHAEKLADHAATLRLLTDNVGLLRQRIDQVEKAGFVK